MAKWLLVVETSCADAAREAEFNDWYDKIHAPDVMENPGFIRARRYENIESSEGKLKYLATYEVEADDIGKVMQVMRANIAEKRAEGRTSELIVLGSTGIYREITCLSK